VVSIEPQRILVIRRRYLGDIVLLGSALHNLRLHWPTASITVLVEGPYRSLLTLNPHVGLTLTFPRKATEWPAFLLKVRRLRFTHVLDFDNTERTALVARVTGAPVRATYDRELNRVRARWLYTHFAEMSDERYRSQPIIETYHALHVAIGVPIRSRDVRLEPRAKDLAAAARLVAGQGPKILLHPGTRSPYRLWPVERFAALADRLQDELGAQVFVAAGPGELPTANAIREHAQSHVIVLDQRFTSEQFAALLAQFDFLVCHDSGPMHIATAVGTRVIALYSSQNATIWRPNGDGHVVLQTELPCTCLPANERPGPCVAGDSYHSYCVRKLSVDTVYTAVAKAIHGLRGPKGHHPTS